MKTLRLLTLSMLLTAAFSINASAQQGGNDCTPGNTQSPPCAAAQAPASDDETGAAVTDTAQETNTDLITEVTMDLVEILLSIF